MQMRRVTLAVAIVCCVLVPNAAAATVSVNAFGCFSGGGTRIVPAGSTISIRQGFAEQTRGVLTALLRAQTTTVAVGGGPAVDVTNGYSAPEQRPDGSWVSFVTHPTSTTLAAGESLSFVLTFALDHVVPEVLIPPAGGEPGRPAFNAVGTLTWACTVTAA